MPYRILARNQAGSTVTRWDMRNPQPIRNLAEAQRLADEFAQTRGHGGPWQGLVEYYRDEDSIKNNTVSAVESLRARTPQIQPKRRPGMVDVEV